jgi:hypothetical protein
MSDLVREGGEAEFRLFRMNADLLGALFFICATLFCPAPAGPPVAVGEERSKTLIVLSEEHVARRFP